jgi:hypothetical protein
MIAPQPRPRPTLEVITTPVPGDDTVRAAAVIDQYAAEHQFVGALMWLAPAETRTLIDLVPATAIVRPVSRWAYELIGRVTGEGKAPTPPAVLTAGARYPARDALDPTQPPTPAQHHQLALYLFDAYAQAIAPHTAAPTYARDVLEQAYRQAFAAAGAHMQQLAAGGAERDDLTAEFRCLQSDLAQLWWRAEAAATLSGG